MAVQIRKILIAVLLGVFVWSCQDDDVSPEAEPGIPDQAEIVVAKKEVRAAWISTVYNLDWPTTKGDVGAQKSELITILNRLQALNFNAVVLQVRPMADAFYSSQLEPWSSYLTGVQGADPGYDPLAFAVDEAHKRGLELHAWLNPYRIGPAGLQLASSHVAVSHPDWVVTFKDVRYFNPGIPEVRQHLKAVVRDLISRYAIDAIHFDDYFYPSGAKSASNPFGFDDQLSFARYGGSKDIHTWRADNVNAMVREVYETVRAANPKVLFGISPSGRRENSLELYADPFVWMDNKWIDYLAPQIYWEFGHATADFAKQAAFWNGNSYGVPVMIGIAAYKYKDPSYPAFGTVSEFDRQLDLVGNYSKLYGCIFFRTKSLENTELFSFLKNKYKYQSLLPEMGKLTAAAVGAPALTLNNKKMSWNTVSGAQKYVVYELKNDAVLKNKYTAHAVQINQETQFSGTSGKSYFVTAVNEDNVESARSAVVSVE